MTHGSTGNHRLYIKASLLLMMRGAPSHIYIYIIPKLLLYIPLNFSTLVTLFSSYRGCREDAKFSPKKAFV